MKTHQFLTTILLFLIITNLTAQVGIGNSEPDASSALDITSTTGGLLPPRKTTSNRNAIGSPATGLIVFNTTDNILQIAEGAIIYGDWYLPSKYELNLMYQMKTTINTTALENNGSDFSSYWYWSSTDFSTNNAWGQKLSDGRQANGSKNTEVGVRAVRFF